MYYSILFKKRVYSWTHQYKPFWINNMFFSCTFFYESGWLMGMTADHSWALSNTRYRLLQVEMVEHKIDSCHKLRLQLHMQRWAKATNSLYMWTNLYIHVLRKSGVVRNISKLCFRNTPLTPRFSALHAPADLRQGIIWPCLGVHSSK